MTIYNTKQRKILFDFFSHHTDEDFTAKQIAEALSKDKISTSAIYRNLSSLVQDGLIKRSTIPGRNDVYYQFIATPECMECIHLLCKVCGKSFHMDSDDSNTLINNIEKNKKFMIDKSETVIYGICYDCHDQER